LINYRLSFFLSLFFDSKRKKSWGSARNKEQQVMGLQTIKILFEREREIEFIQVENTHKKMVGIYYGF